MNRNVGLKKVEAKITQGPVLRRAALGEIGNRTAVFKTNLNEKKSLKPVTRSVSSVADNSKKNVRIAGTR